LTGVGEFSTEARPYKAVCGDNNYS